MTNDPAVLRGTWSFPTTIWFGAGKITMLARACKTLGMTKPLFVTDPGLAGLEMVTSALAPAQADGVAATLFSAELPLPILAIPTTAGTGSETGRSTVVLNEATQHKVIITHPGMMPGIVIADPELTLGLPAHITAATGMDALAHCLEAYCSPFDNPLCDGVALEGMRLVRENLTTAVADGSDLAARSHMLAAAAMGSTAFQKGLGAIHAMSHPIGALYDTHHGLTNAVVMPYVLNRNQAVIETKLARVADYLGLTRHGDTGFDAFLDWTLALRTQFDMPHTLAGLGVEPERFDELAEMAAADPTALANPITLDAAGFRELFEVAYAGDLD